MIAMLKSAKENKHVNLVTIDEAKWAEINCGQEDSIPIDISIKEKDFDECQEVMHIIVYLAGYCCFSVNKKIGCDYCKELMTHTDDHDFPETHNYIVGISRGSLLHPSPVTVNIIMYNYIVIKKLTKMNIYRNAKNQRNMALASTLKMLNDNCAKFPVDTCDAGHDTEKLDKMLVWASTNSLLNNFCRKENDVIACKKNTGKKRKLQTLT